MGLNFFWAIFCCLCFLSFPLPIQAQFGILVVLCHPRGTEPGRAS